jgi:hypothetical protein
MPLIPLPIIIRGLMTGQKEPIGGAGATAGAEGSAGASAAGGAAGAAGAGVIGRMGCIGCIAWGGMGCIGWAILGQQQQQQGDIDRAGIPGMGKPKAAGSPSFAAEACPAVIGHSAAAAGVSFILARNFSGSLTKAALQASQQNAYVVP